MLVVGITGLRLIPAYMEDRAIKNVFAAVAHDPDMQSAQIYEVQNAFSRRASINDIKAINPSDIVIDRSNGKLFLSAEYVVKIPLVANISLYLEFNPTSEK
ncbi:MAG TPA: DUF4845 domain-containing protein [Gallionella sp.]